LSRELKSKGRWALLQAIAPSLDIVEWPTAYIHLVNIGKNVMHAVMRDYSGSGAKKFFDLLESKKAEVKDVMMPIRGFVSYSLVRTARGGFSVTICQDKAGTDESVRVAREWIAKNACDTRVARPKISAGTVILHL
jgi:hypothetical protein